MKQGTALVAGNGDLKYPGYTSYLAAKITYIPPTSVALLPGGKTNTAASSSWQADLLLSTSCKSASWMLAESGMSL
jgi:hypothetical protein